MPTYRVIRKSDGEEVTRYCAGAVTESFDGKDYPATDFDHVEFVEGEVDATYRGSWHITKLAFRQRFTQTEKAGIEIAALDDPAAPMQQRGLAASLRANQQDIQAATYIDLQRADTRSGVMALEQFGLIAAGRAAVILDTVPTEEELYRGE